MHKTFLQFFSFNTKIKAFLLFGILLSFFLISLPALLHLPVTIHLAPSLTTPHFNHLHLSFYWGLCRFMWALSIFPECSEVNVPMAIFTQWGNRHVSVSLFCKVHFPNHHNYAFDMFSPLYVVILFGNFYVVWFTFWWFLFIYFYQAMAFRW